MISSKRLMIESSTDLLLIPASVQGVAGGDGVLGPLGALWPGTLSGSMCAIGVSIGKQLSLKLFLKFSLKLSLKLSLQLLLKLSLRLSLKLSHLLARNSVLTPSSPHWTHWVSPANLNEMMTSQMSVTHYVLFFT